MAVDKGPFIILEADEPIIQQAIDAIRQYHDAKDLGAPAEEERLRVPSESLYQAESDYQLRVEARTRGRDGPPLP